MMPGTKRKSDEDPWIVAQTKKFKAGLILANVYEGTLAQLRLGARNFFKSSSSSSSSRVLPSTPPSSPCSIADMSIDDDEEETPSSPVIRDVVGHQVEDKQQIQQQEVRICGSCALEARDSWDIKCYYCEMTVCHVSPCQGCKEAFCGNCCITKYDNPSFETYSCYTCMSY